MEIGYYRDWVDKRAVVNCWGDAGRLAVVEYTL